MELPGLLVLLLCLGGGQGFRTSGSEAIEGFRV